MRRGWWLVVAALVCVGCGEDEKPPEQRPPADMAQQEMGGGQDMAPDGGPDEEMGVVGPQIPQGCNPVAFEHDCMLPYPSDVFLADDAALPSGKRVVIPAAAQLKRSNGQAIDFLRERPIDGFSHHQPIMTLWPQGVDDSGLIGPLDDLDASLAATSQTVLLDAQTGMAVPHWAELDGNAPNNPARQALIIRPAIRLKNGARYIVGVKGLKDKGGAAIEAPQGFKQVRDAQVTGHPVLAPLAERYGRDIFPALEAHGVNRSELQLAWDFTTMTREHMSRDMLDIRADLLAKLAQTPPAVTISEVQQVPLEGAGSDPNIAVRIRGTLDVPLYMTADAAGARLNRDASGKVVANGVAKVGFLVQLPRSVVPEQEEFEPVRLMQYGHGFFGRGEEINFSFMRGFSNEQRYVTAAVDWQGMDEDDRNLVLNRITTMPSEALQFTERIHQGMANQIALSVALRTTIADLDEVKRFGKLVYDPATIFYYGISQGAILGVTFLALSPHIDRAVLSVGGASFSFMMSRSLNFAPFLALISSIVARDPLDMQKFAMLAQHPFDFVDPMSWAPELLTSTLPDSPASRKILYQIGLGDAQVPVLSTYIMARSIGLPLLTPSSFTPWGMTTVNAPADSALVTVDFGLDPEPGIVNMTVAEPNPVHEAVRRAEIVKKQIDQFFSPDGRIQNTCGESGCVATP